MGVNMVTEIMFLCYNYTLSNAHKQASILAVNALLTHICSFSSLYADVQTYKHYTNMKLCIFPGPTAGPAVTGLY